MIMGTESIIRKRFTVDEYHRMSDIGIFPEDQCFELIRGQILEMPTAKPTHSGLLNRLNHLFTIRLGEFAIVSIQNPCNLDDHSEPAPDVALLKPRSDFYVNNHPLPEDVLLVLEVSDTTLRFDARIKSRLYAEAGIPEYWIVNIPQNALEVRRESLNGHYATHQTFRHGRGISTLAFPDLTFGVDEILGR